MKKLNLVNNMSRSFHKVGFQVKKHSPAMLLVAGITGVVVGTVMACKATTKVNDILEESKEKLDVIKSNEEISEKAAKKEITVAYAQTGLKLTKLYGPSLLVGGLSIASILASYKILNGRNVALTAAYAAVDKGFKDYRKNVKERFGDKVDHELKHNIKQEIVKTIEIDENGNEKQEEKTVEVSYLDQYSDFAKFFDETSSAWVRDAEQNLVFLKMQQNYANDKLKAQGYLYLNDVYKMLGIPATKAGHVVGWIYDEKNPIGDNYVDFGIYDITKPGAREFVNGYEKSILLDFNVDGNIWELMA